jgi:negative regulator of sigma E activity
MTQDETTSYLQGLSVKERVKVLRFWWADRALAGGETWNDVGGLSAAEHVAKWNWTSTWVPEFVEVIEAYRASQASGHTT